MLYMFSIKVVVVKKIMPENLKKWRVDLFLTVLFFFQVIQ